MENSKTQQVRKSVPLISVNWLFLVFQSLPLVTHIKKILRLKNEKKIVLKSTIYLNKICREL